MTGSTGVVDLLDLGALVAVVSGAAVEVAAKLGVVYALSSQKEEAIDLRVSFLLARTRHKMVAAFPELYRRIEDECEPVAEVLQSLGFLKLADRLVFYRFRKRCLKWGVWVSAEEFSAFDERKYFDPALISHWRDLRGYLEKGMVPALTDAFLRGAGAVKVGEQDSRLRQGDWSVGQPTAFEEAPFRSLGADGVQPTEIWRFLEPFLPGLRWWQVYLHLREVRKGLSNIEFKRAGSRRSALSRSWSQRRSFGDYWPCRPVDRVRVFGATVCWICLVICRAAVGWMNFYSQSKRLSCGVVRFGRK